MSPNRVAFRLDGEPQIVDSRDIPSESDNGCSDYLADSDSRTALSGRFFAKVDRRGDDECWPWLGATLPNGRGQFYVGRRGGRLVRRYAYAMSWALANGQDVPARCVVRHSCDNPNCVNPKHLTPGTQAQNIADAVTKGRYTAWHRTGVRLDGRQARRQPIQVAGQCRESAQGVVSHARKPAAVVSTSANPLKGLR